LLLTGQYWELRTVLIIHPGAMVITSVLRSESGVSQ
jgi:hypothetical protein